MLDDYTDEGSGSLLRRRGSGSLDRRVPSISRVDLRLSVHANVPPSSKHIGLPALLHRLVATAPSHCAESLPCLVYFSIPWSIALPTARSPPPITDHGSILRNFAYYGHTGARSSKAAARRPHIAPLIRSSRFALLAPLCSSETLVLLTQPAHEDSCSAPPYATPVASIAELAPLLGLLGFFDRRNMRIEPKLFRRLDAPPARAWDLKLRSGWDRGCGRRC